MKRCVRTDITRTSLTESGTQAVVQNIFSTQDGMPGRRECLPAEASVASVAPQADTPG